jgi:hypothetical protein
MESKLETVTGYNSHEISQMTIGSFDEDEKEKINIGINTCLKKSPGIEV